jgi:hypothetical protein
MQPMTERRKPTLARRTHSVLTPMSYHERMRLEQVYEHYVSIGRCTSRAECLRMLVDAAHAALPPLGPK